MTDIYGGTDPRDLPAYSISDASRYLLIPANTIRSWTVGRSYPIRTGSNFFHPLINIQNSKPTLLSFTNLIEVHILRAIRKQHQIEIDKVRTALDYVEEVFKTPHPLLEYERFRTDGVDLLVERYGSLINASRKGQTELKDSFNAHLDRIEPDDTGLAIKLYPFSKNSDKNSLRLVVIDPRISFGRLVIAGTGITARILWERFQAGDSIEYLAKDYNCDPIKIEEAIRCESRAA
jgi:uncharacterized protein (DUF433 family)